MLGALITFIAGWSIRKLWPTGVLFLLIFSAVSVAFGLVMRRSNLELLGERVTYDGSTIGIAYGSTLLVHTIIFMIAFGFSKLFTKLRKRPDEQKAENPVAD